MSVAPGSPSDALARLTRAHQTLWSLPTPNTGLTSPAAALHDVVYVRSARKRPKDACSNNVAQALRGAARPLTKRFARIGMGVGAALVRPLDAAFGTGRTQAPVDAIFAKDAPKNRTLSAIHYALDVGALGALGGALSAGCALAGAAAASVIGIVAGGLIAAGKKHESPSRLRVFFRAVQNSAHFGAIAGLSASLVPLAALRLGVEGARFVSGMIKLMVAGALGAIAGMVGCAAGVMVGRWSAQATQPAARATGRPTEKMPSKDEAFMTSKIDHESFSSPADASSPSDDTMADWEEVRHAIALGRASGAIAPLSSSYGSVSSSPQLLSSVPFLAFDDDTASLWQIS